MGYQIPKRLTEREAAEYLGIKSQTLQNWRAANCAPPFYRVRSKIVYDLLELEAWMQARRFTPASTNHSEEMTAAAI